MLPKLNHYLESQADLVSRLITPITHALTLVILISNYLLSPYEPPSKVQVVRVRASRISTLLLGPCRVQRFYSRLFSKRRSSSAQSPGWANWGAGRRKACALIHGCLSKLEVFFGGPFNKHHSVWVKIWTPYFGKLPHLT